MLAMSAESPETVISQSSIYQAYTWRQGWPFPLRHWQGLTTSHWAMAQRGLEHSFYKEVWHWCPSNAGLHPAQLPSIVGLDFWHNVVTLLLWSCWDSQFDFKDDKPIFCVDYLFITFSCLHVWDTRKNEELYGGSRDWSINEHVPHHTKLTCSFGNKLSGQKPQCITVTGYNCVTLWICLHSYMNMSLCNKVHVDSN